MKTVLCENKKEKSGTDSNRFRWWSYLMQKSPCFKNQHRTTHTFLKDAKVTYKSQPQKQFYNSKPWSYLLYKISIFKNKNIYLYIYLFGYLTLDFKSNGTKQFNIYSILSNSSIQMPYKKIFDNTVPEKTQKSEMTHSKR